MSYSNLEYQNKTFEGKPILDKEIFPNSSIRFKIKNKINREIVHFAEGGIKITSLYRTIYYEKEGRVHTIKMPEGYVKRIFGLFRLSRRALRLDKLNVYLLDGNLIIIRQGKVYLYKHKEQKLIQTLKLRNCRNVLHQSICQDEEGNVFFGEYGGNKTRKEVPVYKSVDRGMSWEVVYEFPRKSIKHIHGCYYDKFTKKIWVCTGDFKNENWLLVANSDFQEVEKIGDGQQRFRTCNLFFTKDKVHWLMDSQLECSHHVVLDRQSREVFVGQKLMGPVWYIKELTDGYYLAATAQEIGPGILDDNAYLYVSSDLVQWTQIAKFKHDGYPKRYFKFGVIGFADGAQSSKSFYMFFESIKNLDGKSLECSLALLYNLRPYDKFKNIVLDDLFALEFSLKSENKLESVEIWCEKILRYVEINISDLKKIKLKEIVTKDQTVDFYNKLNDILILKYRKDFDLRYLNASLKLTDLGMISKESKVMVNQIVDELL